MESLKIFITGAGGFMGSHLVEFLQAKGHEVHGILFGPVNLVSEIKHKANLTECDIRNKEKLKDIISKVKPHNIYHLAAQSYPTVSWAEPALTTETNIIGTINLFECIKEMKLACRVLVAGSSAEYGFVTLDEVPVKESHELKPLHPYGVTKVAQEGLTYQYYKNFGIDSFTMRIFNTTGPRKVNDVCADFTKQLALIETGQQEPTIKVGNLQTRRAITDVRDTIRGFYIALEKCKPGEAYNISGSKAYLIKDILDIGMGFCSIKPEIFVDPALLRPTDELIIFGDSTKLYEATGWQQEIPIEQTIKDSLNYWKLKFGI